MWCTFNTIAPSQVQLPGTSERLRSSLWPSGPCGCPGHGANQHSPNKEPSKLTDFTDPGTARATVSPGLYLELLCGCLNQRALPPHKQKHSNPDEALGEKGHCAESPTWAEH